MSINAAKLMDEPTVKLRWGAATTDDTVVYFPLSAAASAEQHTRQYLACCPDLHALRALQLWQHAGDGRLGSLPLLLGGQVGGAGAPASSPCCAQSAGASRRCGWRGKWAATSKPEHQRLEQHASKVDRPRMASWCCAGIPGQASILAARASPIKSFNAYTPPSSALLSPRPTRSTLGFSLRRAFSPPQGFHIPRTPRNDLSPTTAAPAS